ncbi:hypothetical protein GCM10009416_28070 [Craurococcus roseus]|uniref:Hedgehog/Intein (Hint) domain-containing protein n=1 Tax=Craurococcus roseus TaxID=77585 RepID=A0ABP3QFQ5_9PROT
MGRQTVSRRSADPLRVLPVRIGARALGERLPRRGLLVSPDHALFLDGVLVHAEGAAERLHHPAGYPEGRPFLVMPFPRAKSRRQAPLSLRRRLAALAEKEPSVGVA